MCGRDRAQFWDRNLEVAEDFQQESFKFGIRSVNLTTIASVEITDKALNEELMKALSAIAEHSADRIKTVDLTFGGQGGREVAVAYVNEMPIWKTSFDFAPTCPGCPESGSKLCSPLCHFGRLPGSSKSATTLSRGRAMVIVVV